MPLLKYKATATQIIIADPPPKDSQDCKAFAKLDPFLQLEIAKYLTPHGPLQYHDLSCSGINLDAYLPTKSVLPSLGSPSKRKPVNGTATSDPRILIDQLHAIAEEKLQHLSALQKAVQLPEKSLAGFWIAYKTYSELSEASKHLASRIPVSMGSLQLGEHSAIELQLVKQTFGVSCRWYREHGPAKFIRFAVKETMLAALKKDERIRKRVYQLLMKDVIVAGRTYQFAFAKEGTFFLHLKDPTSATPFRNFIESEMPLEINSGKQLSKFVSRAALGLSKTKPTLKFVQPETGAIQVIRREPDIFSKSLTISYELMKALSDEWKLGYVPYAIEGKIRDRVGNEEIQLSWRVSSREDSRGPTIEIPKNAVQMRKGHLSERVIKFFIYKRGKWQSKRFPVENVKHIFHTLNRKWDGPGKCMTDGFGLISRSAAYQITQLLGIQAIPTCFQARIGGAKGLWAISPDPASRDEPPWILIRESQHKYDENDPLRLVFEIVRVSTQSRSLGAVGKQTIQVLSHGGVTASTFLKLISDSADLKTKELEDPDDILTLRSAIEYATASVASYPAIKSDNINDNSHFLRPKINGALEDEDVEVLQTQSVSSRESSVVYTTTYDGEPRLPIEQIRLLLNAGYTPANCPHLASLWSRYAISQIEIGTTAYLVPVPRSCNLFVIVDPIGVLEENEIYVQFSESFVDPASLESISILEGTVLVTREPCVLPTDVRKVVAVNVPQLSIYQDVIVFPCKGDRSLCSILSGGDYDGDTVRVIWDREIVAQFQNSDLKYADPAFKEEEYFKSDKRRVQDLLSSAQVQADDEQEEQELELELKRAFLLPLLTPTVFGMVNCSWTAATYKYGLDDPIAVKAAQLFAAALDAPKQGLEMYPYQLKELRTKCFGNEGMPEWFNASPIEQQQREGWTIDSLSQSKPPRSRDSQKGEHIMDVIRNNRQKINAGRIATIREKLQELTARATLDPDLDVFERLKELAEMNRDVALLNDLDIIKSHCKEVRQIASKASDSWRKEKDLLSSPTKQRNKSVVIAEQEVYIDAAKARFEECDILREKRFSGFRYSEIDAPTLQKLKASCLYRDTFDPTRTSLVAMPFRLAFEPLLALKADAVTRQGLEKQGVDQSAAAKVEAHREVPQLRKDACESRAQKRRRIR